MKMYLIRLMILWLTLSLPVVMIGYIIAIRQSSNIILAQGDACSRPDLPPAPVPLVSTQPALSQVETVLSDEANQRNWARWVLNTIAKQESNWRQVDMSQDSPTHCQASGGERACTCVSPGGGYGMMQLNWSVHHNTMDWERVQRDYVYNINQGAGVLAASAGLAAVNNGDFSSAGYPINWYAKLWGYNGYSNLNNPNNPRYSANRNWKDNENSRIDCPKQGEVYTYQEEIF